MTLNGYDKNAMTYQQLLLTMWRSVGLLYVFVYIIKVDMLDVEEIPLLPFGEGGVGMERYVNSLIYDLSTL
jgi:hypothetical protein